MPPDPSSTILAQDDIDSADAFSTSLAPDISATLSIDTASTIDLIVVPASRSLDYLAAAAELSITVGKPLIIIASHGLKAELAQHVIRSTGIVGEVIEIPDRYTLPCMQSFATTTHPRTRDRSSNLSMKRNIGLLLGRLTGQNILFLDDDIRNLTTHKFKLAGAALEKYAVAGFLSYDFPDNSVVRHAYRLSGGDQAVFIAGNSLAVQTARCRSFFPNVYNEDWLFFHDAVENHQAVSIGEVNQLPYEPFIPGRARSEEFGCVLATEGLYTLLADHLPLSAADDAYWRAAINRRKSFVADVSKRLDKSGMPPDKIKLVQLALSASKAELETFDPRDFMSYVQAWRNDIDRWNNVAAALPTNLTVEDAVRYIQKSVL